MNWKRILLATLGGGLAGTLGQYSTEAMQGHHVAFTAGNIVVPAIAAALPTVLALFTRRPQDK